jgi:hypothetical protein
MALEATHMRFALDLKDYFEIKNACEYLSGTIYPDSRYVSGIDRDLTHPKDLFERKHAELSDFEKGWLVHLICDKLQSQLIRERFPEIEQMEKGEGNSRWVYHTSLKILQDLADVRAFDIQSCFPCLRQAFNPNGEEIEKIEGYNAIFPVMYAEPEHVTAESVYGMWKKFGISAELIDKLRQSTERQGRDPQTVTHLSTLYNEMLTRARDWLVRQQK